MGCRHRTQRISGILLIDAETHIPFFQIMKGTNKQLSGHGSFFHRYLQTTAALALSFLFIGATGAFGQDDPAARRAAAAAIADRQALNEKMSRLTSTVEALVNDQVNLLNQIQSQAAEIRELRAEVARLKADQEIQNKAAEKAVTEAEFKALVAQINQNEVKRKKDQELILESIEEIGKARIAAIQSASASASNNSGSESRTISKPDPKPSIPTVGYNYTVQSGDTISSIVASYRESGVPVTVPLVLKANPNVVPSRLQVGTELFIPDPREE